MGLIGLQYRHPQLYALLIRLIHRKAVIEAFKKEVGKNGSVQDIAAGFGQMSNYIDKSNSYRGIDLNEKFVLYGQKRGINLKHASIFDPAAYEVADVAVLVDVIHHLPENTLKELFDLVFKYTTKKVIILEPAFLNLSSRYGNIAAPLDWLMRKFDDDGLNTISKWYTEDEYRALFTAKFGSLAGKNFKPTIKKVYPYYIITFYAS